ncbi:hypothetical protein OG21DRAFT_1106711 [Imleria badia]|nr:hypothetical protein OG21DRAFT_1106711 [Imleria badia]
MGCCIQSLYYKSRGHDRLRRIYILFSAPHGLRSTDEAMLAELDTQVQKFGGTKFTLQAIITKADQLGESGREHVEQMKNAIFQAAPTCLPLVPKRARILVLSCFAELCLCDYLVASKIMPVLCDQRKLFLTTSLTSCDPQQYVQPCPTIWMPSIIVETYLIHHETQTF